MMYLRSLSTGFRMNALSSLRVSDFDLDADQPTVALSRQTDKSKRGKRHPIPTEVVPLLREFLKGRKPGEKVWNGLKSWKKYAADMVRRDAAEAGIETERQGPDGLEWLDAHTLRHTWLTSLFRAGVDIQTAQTLAGHTDPRVTMKYIHIRLQDMADAVNKLKLPTDQTPPVTPVGARDLGIRMGILTEDNSTHSDAAGCSHEGEPTEEGEPPEVFEIAGDSSGTQTRAVECERGGKVEQKRFELSTYALRTRRSPN